MAGRQGKNLPQAMYGGQAGNGKLGPATEKNGRAGKRKISLSPG